MGDEDDHLIWRQARRAWLAATADVLFAHFPAEKLDFGPREPDQAADWKRQFEAELRTVREAMTLLDRLDERIETSALVGHVEGH